MSIIVRQDATIYSFIIFLQTALHVSDDTHIHHQEHTQTVITSGTGWTVFATVRWRWGVRSHVTYYVLITSATSQWTARNKVPPNKVHSAEFMVSRRFPCRVRYSQNLMKPETSLPCSLGPFLTQFSPVNIITWFNYLPEQDTYI